MNPQIDKIRVLLLDDNPSFLEREELFEGSRYNIPLIHDQGANTYYLPELEELFDLRWLATAVESREYRDWLVAIARGTPRLEAHGLWVPEILCFDYALTGNTDRVCERGIPVGLVDRLTPLQPSTAKSAAIEALTPAEPPATGAAKDDDNQGCFAGGLIFAKLSDHPCGPVAVTRKGPFKTHDTEAAFFEWMLECESHGTFVAKGRPAVTWNELLIDGVRALRTQIKQLAAQDAIQISLDDLLQLAENGDHPVLTVRSRYGRRRLPAEALFIDQPPTTARKDAKSQWAESILTNLMSPLRGEQDQSQPLFAGTRADLARGRDLADLLWAAYNDDERFDRRVSMSQLLARRAAGSGGGQSLSDQDRQLLADHLKYFGIGEPDKKRAQCERNYIDFRHAGFSDRARRWAALFTIVYLLQRRAEACDARHSQQHGAAHADPSLEFPIRTNDVYLALFPVPQTPLILPFHAAKGDASSSWSKYLNELWSDRANKEGTCGDLALSIQDVLDGKHWTDDPRNPTKNADHGLLPGERLVLQMFAEAVGFGREKWNWDPSCVSVLGASDTDSGKEADA
jgi:hypothetical protein